MGVSLQFTRDFQNFKKGRYYTLDRGVADVFVNRRKCAVYLDNPEALVPLAPGLQQVVDAAGALLKGKSRKVAK